MSTRYEGADARWSSVTVVPAGTEIGECTTTDPAVVVSYDEVFYIEGTPARLRELLNHALTMLERIELVAPRPVPDLDAIYSALMTALPHGLAIRSNGPEVTDFYIVKPDTGIPGEPGTEHLICLAHDFNAPGRWEAMLDKNGDCSSLPDGPSVTAPPDEVAAWAVSLLTEKEN